ncbi:hypothetical protein FE257_000885 [Aspergillus nanangensis]|uniref:Uncharacterized protein n=1 Tax=Aspergillus nanangensis TaxID=2582783 RepID=A0AAD4CED8_ASPNN|nr:hypothetical protein FE257_000885 [Aspergillus nanangensis]
MLAQVRAVLLKLSPAQLECAALWIDEARVLQNHGFILSVLVDRMWGLTLEDEAFAKLRLYRLFTVEWIQRMIPRLSPAYLGFIKRVAEHNRLVMEGRYPASLARMAYRLITPDLLVVSLFGLSASRRKAIEFTTQNHSIESQNHGQRTVLDDSQGNRLHGNRQILPKPTRSPSTAQGQFACPMELGASLGSCSVVHMEPSIGDEMSFTSTNIASDVRHAEYSRSFYGG